MYKGAVWNKGWGGAGQEAVNLEISMESPLEPAGLFLVSPGRLRILQELGTQESSLLGHQRYGVSTRSLLSTAPQKQEGVKERPRPFPRMNSFHVEDGGGWGSVFEEVWFGGDPDIRKPRSLSGWLLTASCYNLLEPDFFHLQSGIILISTLRIVLRLKEYTDES